MGYVYFLQPSLAIGTNRYKIGCSTKDNNNRINSYGKNTELLYRYDTIQAEKLEKKIIKKFKERFILYQGKEYFEGDISEMLAIFIQTIYDYELENKPKSSSKTFKVNKTKFVLPHGTIQEQLMLYRATQNIKYHESD